MTRLFSFILCLLSTLTLSSQTYKLTDTVFNVGDIYIARGIYFDFDKGQGIRKESKVQLDSIVNFMNNNVQLILEIGGHLCSRGIDEYTSFESKRRAECVFRHLVNEGISEKRLATVGYGETKPIAPNQNPDGSDNPDGRQINRRIELKILKTRQTFKLTDTVFDVGDIYIAERIYFDYGKSDIRLESSQELNDIVAFMNRHQSLTIEIGGHINRGHFAAELSQQRANALMKELIKMGIRKKRLTAVGYGDNKPYIDEDAGPEDCFPVLGSRRIELKILKVD